MHRQLAADRFPPGTGPRSWRGRRVSLNTPRPAERHRAPVKKKVLNCMAFLRGSGLMHQLIRDLQQLPPPAAAAEHKDQPNPMSSRTDSTWELGWRISRQSGNPTFVLCRFWFQQSSFRAKWLAASRQNSWGIGDWNNGVKVKIQRRDGCADRGLWPESSLYQKDWTRFPLQLELILPICFH